MDVYQRYQNMIHLIDGLVSSSNMQLRRIIICEYYIYSSSVSSYAPSRKDWFKSLLFRDPYFLGVCLISLLK